MKKLKTNSTDPVLLYVRGGGSPSAYAVFVGEGRNFPLVQFPVWFRTPKDAVVFAHHIASAIRGAKVVEIPPELREEKGIPCGNMREFDAVMDGTVQP